MSLADECRTRTADIAWCSRGFKSTGQLQCTTSAILYVAFSCQSRARRIARYLYFSNVSISISKIFLDLWPLMLSCSAKISVSVSYCIKRCCIFFYQLASFNEVRAVIHLPIEYINCVGGRAIQTETYRNSRRERKLNKNWWKRRKVSTFTVRSCPRVAWSHWPWYSRHQLFQLSAMSSVDWLAEALLSAVFICRVSSNIRINLI